jgi:arsenate reductase
LHTGDPRVTITIYHNPSCGTSRNVLSMIRKSGEDPEVIEYLKTPPTREKLVDLLNAMNMKPRELLRQKGTPYDELGLNDAALSDEDLIGAMMAHPILINRPIVETEKGTKLCRPSEEVLTLLEKPVENFIKEDGDVVTAPGTSA